MTEKGSALYWLEKSKDWSEEDWQNYNEYYRILFDLEDEDEQKGS